MSSKYISVLTALSVRYVLTDKYNKKDPSRFKDKAKWTPE